MNRVFVIGAVAAALVYSQDGSIPQKQLCLKHTALVCKQPTRLSECRSYKAGLVIKSQEVNGTYYKISDMAGLDGTWHAYEEEGWIDANDVDELHEDENATIVPERINATTLVAKEAAAVCIEPKENASCEHYKRGTIFTSTSKYRNYYKISGSVNLKGWQPFTKEGWIDENSVVIRR